MPANLLRRGRSLRLGTPQLYAYRLRRGQFSQAIADDFFEASATGGPVNASVSLNEANDTVSANAGLGVAGGVALTEANDTLVSAGVLALQAALALTEAGDTLASTGALRLAALVSIVEAADTLSAAAVLAIVAAFGAVEANDAMSSVANLAISASFSAVDADTLVAVAEFWSGAPTGEITAMTALITEIAALESSRHSNSQVFYGRKQKNGGPWSGAGITKAMQIAEQLASEQPASDDLAQWGRARNAINAITP